MKRRSIGVLAALCVVAAGCDTDSRSSRAAGSPPDEAPTATVLDRNGVEFEWTGDSSSEGWADLLRADLAGLGLGDRLYDAGVVVETTIDAAMQGHLVDALMVVPDTKGRFETASVAVDVESGGIVAVADTAGGSLATIRRPTGSALKFLVLAGAVLAGAQGPDVLDGAERCAVPSPGGFTTFTGDPQYSLAQLSDMVAFSVNCAFGKLYAMVGGDQILSLAAQFGLTGVSIDTPAIVTGAASESPLEMAAAMRTVLGAGTSTPAFIVDRVIDAEGQVLFVRDRADLQVLPPEVAHEVATLLTNVVSRGTARTSSLAGGRTGAAKTGTQDGNTDAWMVGGTPQLSVAVWMGNPANPSDGMVEVPEFVDVPRVQGGTYPAAVWKAFLDESLEGVSPVDWPAASEDRQPLRLFLPGVECPVVDPVSTIQIPAVPEGTSIESC